MNNKKTAEIWMEFDRELRGRGEPAFADKEELHNLLLWMERFTGIRESCRLYTGSNEINIHVDDGKDPIPACIRIYSVTGSLSDRIALRRLTTAADGRAVVSVPEGSYRVEVWHGPCFHNWEAEFCVPANHSYEDAGRPLLLHAVLRRKAAKQPGWIAGDLHHHSIYSSPAYGGTDAVVEEPEEIRIALQAAGCSFGALSDHHNTHNHAVWIQEERQDFFPLISKEISTSNGHVAALGAEEDIIYRIPRAADRTAEYLRAEYVRTAQAIRYAGGIPQLNHPFDTSVSTSWPQEFNDVVSVFSSIEIWNGAHPMLKSNGNGQAVQWWLSLLTAGYPIAGTAGSDTHNVSGDAFDRDLDELCRIMERIPHISFPDTMREQIDILEAMGRRSLAPFLDWASHHLGSGCVVTYVRVDDRDSSQEAVGYGDMPAKICHAIEEGCCMVTDGPLLFVQADDVWPGGRREICGETFTLKAHILFDDRRDAGGEEAIHGRSEQEDPIRLAVYLSDGRVLYRSVEQPYACDESGVSLVWEGIAAGGAMWIVCTLETHSRYRAITNPIYL